MVSESVVKAVRQYLNVVNNKEVPVSFGVVYGSQVSGTWNQWSDIDLIVVSSKYDRGLTHEDAAVLWELAPFTDARIEPIPCGEKQWEEGGGDSALIAIAHREGVKIMP